MLRLLKDPMCSEAILSGAENGSLRGGHLHLHIGSFCVDQTILNEKGRCKGDGALKGDGEEKGRTTWEN